MAVKAYLSNISPRWPIERQEEMLRAAIPTWPKGVSIFKDELDQREKRAHRKNDLTERAALLRGTTRKGGVNEIILATMAAWDWSAEGMLAGITLALSRGETIRILDAGLTIKPDATAADLAAVTAAFEAARKADKALQRGSPGGKASAEKRTATAKAKALAVLPLWRLPSSEWAQSAIAAQAGLSVNTLKLYLPPRGVAQAEYRAEQKRSKTRAARAAKEGG